MAFDAADLAAFIDPDMPGAVSAAIDGQTVVGLFRQKYEEAFGMVGGTGPALRVLDSIAVDRGSIVVIDSRTFSVVEIRDEQFGMRVLKLEAA
jgi:hypothetical protein